MDESEYEKIFRERYSLEVQTLLNYLVDRAGKACRKADIVSRTWLSEAAVDRTFAVVKEMTEQWADVEVGATPGPNGGLWITGRDAVRLLAAQISGRLSYDLKTTAGTIEWQTLSLAASAYGIDQGMLQEDFWEVEEQARLLSNAFSAGARKVTGDE